MRVGATGGTAYPLGEPVDPTSNLADALTIMAAENLKSIAIVKSNAGSPATSIADLEIVGIGRNDTGRSRISFAGAGASSGAVFRDMTIFGTQTASGNARRFLDCNVGAPATLGGDIMERCLVESGTFSHTTNGGESIDASFEDVDHTDDWAGMRLRDCDGVISLDYTGGGSGSSDIDNFQGRVTIKNISSGTINIRGGGGKVILDSTMANGTVNILGGDWDLVDNKTGGTINHDEPNDLDTILVDTNEIQGKLPDNNIMGSGVTTNKDDEIDAIKTSTDAILIDTADMQPKLGAPAGASISADNLAIQTAVDQKKFPNGAVYCDGATQATTVYPAGELITPSDDISDALTISNTNNIDTIISSVDVITETLVLTDKTLESGAGSGVGARGTFGSGNKTLLRTTLKGWQITTAGANGVSELSKYLDCTVFPGTGIEDSTNDIFERCNFQGTGTLNSGYSGKTSGSRFVRSHFEDLTIDVANYGIGSITVKDCTGILTLVDSGVVGATKTIEIDSFDGNITNTNTKSFAVKIRGGAGVLTIDVANVAGSTVIEGGDWKVIDNSGGGHTVTHQKPNGLGDILTDTNEIQGKLPDNKIMGSSVTTDKDDEIDAIKTATDQLAFTGGNVHSHTKAQDNLALTVQQKLDVNTEADTALSDINLDHMMKVAAVGTDVTDNSVIAKISAKGATADFDTFNNTTDSLEALKDSLSVDGVDWTSTERANIRKALGVDGTKTAGSTAGDLQDTLTDTNEMQGKLPTNNIMGSAVKTDKDDEIDTIKTSTDAILIDTAEIGIAGVGLTNLGGMSTGMKAEVNTEVDGALDTAIPELAQAKPSATPSVRTSLALLNHIARDKTTTTATEFAIFNDADTKIIKQTIADAAGTFTRSEAESGA